MTTEPKAPSPSEPVETGGTLFDQLLAKTHYQPGEDAYAVAGAGLSELIRQIARPEQRETRRVDKAVIDTMIAEIDRKLEAQINEILHAPEVQKLESTWRGVKFAVDRIDFRENTKLELLNASKEDLAEDFEDAPEVTKSAFHRLVYSNAYGGGGKPYGLICGLYDFGPKPGDVEVLSKIASVAAMSHAPFVANASPTFFGGPTFEALADLKDLKTLFEGPDYAKWHAFRENDDARYVALTLPRFLLRLPHDREASSRTGFAFREDVIGHHDRYLWGPASIAFTTRVADSFARSRWGRNIIGPLGGGGVEDLPLHTFQSMGSTLYKPPTELELNELLNRELSDEGFVGLVAEKGTGRAAFYSSSSVLKPKEMADKQKEGNYRLGTQLPYMFIITRLAHYLKVYQLRKVGTVTTPEEMERQLNEWLQNYVTDQPDPAASVRARRPLRSARVKVTEAQPGWYRSELAIQPHRHFVGGTFELSLVGKLEPGQK